jgi:hypothetical protein
MTAWPDKWEKNGVYVWNSSFINQSTQATSTSPSRLPSLS